MAKPTGAAVGGPAAAAAAVTAAAAANGGEHSVIVEAVSVAPAAAPAPAIADQQPVDQAAGMHENAQPLLVICRSFCSSLTISQHCCKRKHSTTVCDM